MMRQNRVIAIMNVRENTSTRERKYVNTFDPSYEQ
jgi:hypothetical protein